MTIPDEWREAVARAIMTAKLRDDQPVLIALADAAILALLPLVVERFERIARAHQHSPAPYCDTLKAIRQLSKEMTDAPSD